MLKSCSDFAQIYLLCQHLSTWKSFYLNILLRFYSDILLKSYSNLAQILSKFICFVNTCWLENLLIQIWVKQNIWARSVFCFLYHASYSRCNHIDMCILLWITHSHCVICIHSVVSLVIMMIFFFQVKWWWWLRISELSWSCVIC